MNNKAHAKEAVKLLSVIIRGLLLWGAGIIAALDWFATVLSLTGSFIRQELPFWFWECQHCERNWPVGIPGSGLFIYHYLIYYMTLFVCPYLLVWYFSDDYEDSRHIAGLNCLKIFEFRKSRALLIALWVGSTIILFHDSIFACLGGFFSNWPLSDYTSSYSSIKQWIGIGIWAPWGLLTLFFIMFRIEAKEYRNRETEQKRYEEQQRFFNAHAPDDDISTVT